MGLSVVFSLFVPFNTANVWAEEATGIVFEEEAPKPVGGDASYKIEYYKENIEVPAPIPRGRKNQDYGWNDEDSVFVKGASTVGYNTLSEDQKKLYRAIDEKALSFMESTSDYQAAGESFLFDQVDITSLGHAFDSSEIEAVYKCYDYDHPAYYWLYNGYNYSDQYLYLYSYNEFRTASVRATDNELINNGIKEYASMAADGADTLDKIAIVHNLLVTDVDYAYKSDGKTPVDEKWAHSPLGVFDTHRKVVCEGYADTFSLVMNYMSIPNYVIVGKSGSDGVANGGFHRWNAVSDDSGKTFMYMDVTWDDLGTDGYYYNYFGAPRSDFEKKHFKGNTNGDNGRWLYDIDTSNFADSFEKTYYCKGGFYYESGDMDEYVNLVKTKSFRFGEKVITLTPRNSTAISQIDDAIPGRGRYNYKITIKGTEYHLQIHNGTTELLDISDGVIKIPTRYYEYKNGEEIKPEPIVSMNGVSILKGRNYTISYTNNTEIGSNATVKATGKGKFSGTRQMRFAITDPHKIDPLLSPPTGKQGLIYNGQAQELINEGTVHGGTLCYTVVEKGQAEPQDSVYEETVPTATNAGTYTVYYRVIGNDDYYDLLPESIDVTIEGANISYSASGYADVYDGQEHTINVIVRTPASGYTVKYGEKADECTLDAPPAKTGAVEKTIYFKITADNYKDVISSRNIQIEKRGIVASNIKAKDKIYDGKREAQLDYTEMNLDGKLPADNLSVTAKGTFESAKVGTDKKVILTEYALTGSSKDNYELTAGAQQAESKADILLRTVTVSGITAKYKNYDGKKTVTLDLSGVRIKGKLTNDRLSVSVNGSFADAEVGTDKKVTLSNLKLVGEDSENYALSESGNQESTTASIVKANVPGTPIIVNMNYICSRENRDSISLKGLPSDRGTVIWMGPDVTGNLTFSEAPSISNGNALAYALAGVSEPEEGSVRVTARMKNYNDVEFCINISAIKQTPTVLKEGSEITLQNKTLTYGQKLSELRFNKAVFVTDDEQKTVVPGTLSWKTPWIAPEAGTLSAVWTFSPTNAKYIPCEGIASVTVNKAPIDPSVSITGWISGETPNAPSVSGNTGNGEVTYVYAVRGSDEYIPDVPYKAGYYTVKAIIAETDNYQGGEAIANFTVKKAGTGEDPDDPANPQEIPVKSIRLSKTTITLNMAKKTYAVLGTPIFNPVNATNKTVTWSSSNTKIATVTDTGIVYGKKNGKAKITATTANGKTASCTVKVKNYVAVKSVRLNKTSVTLDLSKKNKKTVSLKATVNPAKASYKTVSWKSSNENVAKVTAKGNKATVRGVGKGTATITATGADGKKAKCKIKVKKTAKVK